MSQKQSKLNFDLNRLDAFKVYITSLLKILWDYPESVYYALKNAEKVNFKEDLSDFIMNNFFGNNISENYLQNNLLYIIAMMLKDEIERVDNVAETSLFLEDKHQNFGTKYE